MIKFSMDRLILALAGAVYLSLTWQSYGRSLPSPNSPSFEIARPNSSSNNWYEYSPPDGSYSIKFPGQPEEENRSVSSTLGQLNTVAAIYQDMAERRFFFCGGMKYPVEPALYDFEKALNDARDAVVMQFNATVINETKITVRGMPGREFTLQYKGSKVVGRLIVDPKGPSLYQAWVAGPDEILTSPDTRTFLDSLTVLQ